MLNTITETRKKEKIDLDILTLKILEKDFFRVYDNVDECAAYDLLRRYMIYKHDEGIPKEIEINFDDNQKIVTIVAKLNYLKIKNTVKS